MVKVIKHNEQVTEIDDVKRIVLDDNQAHIGVEIYVPGFKHDPQSTDEYGTQFYIECYYGKLRLYVWDGDAEDPQVITIQPNKEQEQ